MPNQVRLPKAVAEDMIEFFRRQYVLGDGSVKRLGNLSTPSEIKRTVELGLAIPSNGKETPRVLNWYTLTNKGKEVIQAYKEAGLDNESFDAYDIKDGFLDSTIRGMRFDI